MNNCDKHKQSGNLRVIFMGTPDFAVPALSAIADSEHHLTCVYTMPPRPKGRGKKETKSPVHEKAEEYGLPVYTPLSLKNKHDQEVFFSHQADIAVVAAYGLILPETVLNSPEYGCVNIHASVLPRWRGASPIQHSILHGDRESGVTIMQMDKGVDTGNIISVETVEIGERKTFSELSEKLSQTGAKSILKILDELSERKIIKSIKQSDDDAVYAPMLTKKDGKINFAEFDSLHIDRMVRALNPWPGTWFEVDDMEATKYSFAGVPKDNQGNRKVKILECEPAGRNIEIKAQDYVPGKLIDKSGLIACGNNSFLRIKKLQIAGKKPMDIVSAINGGFVKANFISM